MYQTVPFQETWISSDKIDAKAIYRRPHRHHITSEIQCDASGQPLWDFSALPVRRHNDWLGKGFEYVTIADAESLGMVAGTLQAQGLNPRDYIMDPRTNSPWHHERYAKDLATQTADEHARLREMVEQFGSAQVERILRAQTPGFELPESLRGMLALAAAAAGRVSEKPADSPAGGTPKRVTATDAPTTTRAGTDKGKSIAGDSELVGGFKG